MDFKNPEKEEQFNKWYNDVHLPENFKFKGMKKAARYRRIGDNKNAPKYLAIYYFDSMEDFIEYDNSPEHSHARSVPGQPEGMMPRFRVQYELIKNWEK